MMIGEQAKSLIVDLCRQFYTLGWVSGTGGGISIKEDGRIYMAPSGVQKERLHIEDIFVLDEQGRILEMPQVGKMLKLSACAPLFMKAYELRGAGAVIHSHSINAVLASLISEEEEFRISHMEMIKGIRGMGYHNTLIVPIIKNTAYEGDLTVSLEEAMLKYPSTFAVLVERHGVYVWGKDWKEAKTHAECYDYLFQVVIELRKLGAPSKSFTCCIANNHT
ncbi:methylthioribulose-1-phosphate dehydratase [Galdieria sulphuraria]|uniref:Probable methylthioribulose-1-phosphate dehydratase n=1 Tax=Galdieria sulphuraria TaxID=130081 RepID=M2XII0_GALSU|nr:methylthioribulose-1-phosphate dehydratase [Galdieria sulphuraria]EME29887.1 methylthioribulose-1-phosphate dehydratase [Galdieria sulphuraria]|eukprot:XP_005706407.1 methylthioribulose-1-phosphate dehydratase [Galdieria sulphuraria]